MLFILLNVLKAIFQKKKSIISQRQVHIISRKNSRSDALFLSYQIDGTVLCLVEDASKILADDADRHQLYATQEEYNDDECGEAMHRFAHQEGFQKHVNHIDEGHSRHDEPHDSGYTQGRGGVRGDALYG